MTTNKSYLKLYFCLILILGLLSASPLNAQFFDPDDEENVTWELEFSPDTVKPGSYVKLIARAEIKAPWHIYSFFEEESLPTSFEFDDLGGLEKVTKWFGQKGEKKVETIGDYTSTSWGLEKETEFHIWVKVPENFSEDYIEVKLKISWQECYDLCLPRDDVPYRAVLEISQEGEFLENYEVPAGFIYEDGTETSKPETQPANDTEVEKPTETSTTEQPQKKDKEPVKSEGEDTDSMLLFLLSAAGFALISLLTPCVFPMIPVTISYFLKLSEKKSTKPVFLSITYVLGIIFTLTFFGLVLALILKQEDIGAQIATMPLVNLIIGIILILFTLSFFGLFELTLPSGIINKLNKIGRNPNTGAAISTFVLGVVFTLTSFACTGPIIGLIISIAVKSGDYLKSFLGMFVYSIFFALPFFFLSLSPNLITKLPKSGSWLMKVKILMGFLIFIFAFYFLKNADYAWNWGFFTRPMVLSIWAVSFVILGLYLFGKIRFKEEGDEQSKGVGAISAIFGILIISIGVYLGASAITGRPVWKFVTAMLPDATYGIEYEGENYYEKKHISEIVNKMKEAGLTSSQSDLKSGAPRNQDNIDGWFLDYDVAIELSKKAGYPVFLEFTGHFCSICKLNKANLFPRAKIKELFKEFTLVELWTDAGHHATKEEGEKNKNLLQKFHGQMEIPVYIIINPETEEVLGKLGGLLSGDSGADKFIEFLENNLEKYKNE